MNTNAPRSITEPHITPRTDSTSGLQQRIKELEAERDALLTENAKFRNELVELDHCRDSASKAEQYEKERDALKAMIDTVINIQNMSDTQIAELKATAQQVIDEARASNVKMCGERSESERT